MAFALNSILIQVKNMQLENLNLPDNIYWQNEFEHKSIAQSIERTVSGGAIVEHASLSYGQKIKLQGAWATRGEVVALKSLENANAVMSFISNTTANSTHSGVCDIEAGGVVANLLSPEVAPDSETLYELTINLLTVEPVV
jgi:hypothetical protein